jgi:hypothetical protein
MILKSMFIVNFIILTFKIHSMRKVKKSRIIVTLVLQIVIWIFFNSKSFADITDCYNPEMNIIGPISQCDAFNGPCNYFAEYAGSGPWGWTCVGGTVTWVGDHATVNWIPNQTTYSLTVTTGDPRQPCICTIYLNDCDCDLVIPNLLTVVDLYDMDHLHGPGPDLYAIANIIDPSATYATVATITIGTTPHNIILVSGADLFIRGQFNLSQTPIYFINCTLHMDKGSVIMTGSGITVISAFSLDGSTIVGTCDNMWQGIRCGHESLIHIFNSSNVADAEYALRVNQKAHLFLEDSYYFRNYICIYAPPGFQGLIEGNIENNDFDGSQNLVSGRYPLQNYVGQFPTYHQHSLPQSDKCFAMMELSDLSRTSTLNRSIPFNLQAHANVIHDFNLGIFSRRSYVDVNNCEFNKIFSVGAYNFYGNFNGTGVYSDSDPSSLKECRIGNYNSLPDIFENTFTDVHRAILIQGSLNTTSINNTIHNVDWVGIEVRRSDPHLIHTIEFNHITDAEFGIYSNLNLQSAININLNEITTLNTGSTGPAGIIVSDVPGTSCIAKVTDNQVTTYSNYGIFARNNTDPNTLFQYNDVIMDFNSLPLASSISGIQLDNCNNNTVDCNWVHGLNSTYNYMNFYGRGIYFNVSASSTVSCNVVQNQFIDFQFKSNCPGTSIYGNSLKSANDGILLGDYSTWVTSDMGFQHNVGVNSPGNLFYGVDNMGTFGNAATMTINSFPFPSSLWMNAGSVYEPLTNYTASGNPILPFNAAGWIPYVCPDVCHVNIHPGDQTGRLEMLAIDPTIPQSIEEELMKWDREKRLFEELSLDSNLLDSSLNLQNFFDGAQFTTAGQLGEISNDISNLLQAKTSGITSEDYDEMVTAVKNKNSAINTSESYEENQKVMNEIKLETIYKDKWDFNLLEWSTILQIANSCPYIDGPAVFDARALANFIDLNLSFDDDVICNASSTFRRSGPKSSFQHSAKIYPNPADRSITINTVANKNESLTINIYNSIGDLILSEVVASSDQLKTIDIHNISSGLYFVNVLKDNQLIHSGKLSISH